MSISITVTGETPEEVRGQLAWAYSQFSAGEVVADIKSRVATKEVVAKAQKKPVEAAAPAPVEQVQEAAPAPITLEAVRAQLKNLGDDKLDAVKKLISSYGVSGLSKVPEDKLADLLDKAQKL